MGKNQWYSTVATISLTMCAVLQIWSYVAAIQCIDATMRIEEYLNMGSFTTGLFYLFFAFAFNFCVAHMEPCGYHITALVMTALHLMCALILMVLSVNPDETIYVSMVVALVNLPVNVFANSLAAGWDAALIGVVFYAANFMVYFYCRSRMRAGKAAGGYTN